MQKWLIWVGVFTAGLIAHLYLVYVIRPDIKPAYSVSTVSHPSHKHSSASGPANQPLSKVFMGYLKLADITYFGNRHPQNKAVIEDLVTSRQATYSVGDILPYGAKISNIQKDQLVLEKNRSEKKLKLLQSLDNAGARQTLLSHGYQQVTQNEWFVIPNELDKKIEHVLSDTEIAPHFVKGIQRFRINNLPDGSLLEELGFLPGDTITTVNGENVTDLNHVLLTCWKIRKSPLITIHLERNHHPINLLYYIISEAGSPAESS